MNIVLRIDLLKMMSQLMIVIMRLGWLLLHCSLIMRLWSHDRSHDVWVPLQWGSCNSSSWSAMKLQNDEEPGGSYSISSSCWMQAGILELWAVDEGCNPAYTYDYT
jgi:hypothetical protein